jgi:hypothetical protein
LSGRGQKAKGKGRREGPEGRRKGRAIIFRIGTISTFTVSPSRIVQHAVGELQNGREHRVVVIEAQVVGKVDEDPRIAGVAPAVETPTVPCVWTGSRARRASSGRRPRIRWRRDCRPQDEVGFDPMEREPS